MTNLEAHVTVGVTEELISDPLVLEGPPWDSGALQLDVGSLTDAILQLSRRIQLEQRARLDLEGRLDAWQASQASAPASTSCNVDGPGVPRNLDLELSQQKRDLSLRFRTVEELAAARADAFERELAAVTRKVEAGLSEVRAAVTQEASKAAQAALAGEANSLQKRLARADAVLHERVAALEERFESVFKPCSEAVLAKMEQLSSAAAASAQDSLAASETAAAAAEAALREVNAFSTASKAASTLAPSVITSENAACEATAAEMAGGSRAGKPSTEESPMRGGVAVSSWPRKQDSRVALPPTLLERTLETPGKDEKCKSASGEDEAKQMGSHDASQLPLQSEELLFELQSRLAALERHCSSLHDIAEKTSSNCPVGDVAAGDAVAGDAAAGDAAAEAVDLQCLAEQLRSELQAWLHHLLPASSSTDDRLTALEKQAKDVSVSLEMLRSDVDPVLAREGSKSSGQQALAISPEAWHGSKPDVALAISPEAWHGSKPDVESNGSTSALDLQSLAQGLREELQAWLQHLMATSSSGSQAQTAPDLGGVTGASLEGLAQELREELQAWLQHLLASSSCVVDDRLGNLEKQAAELSSALDACRLSAEAAEQQVAVLGQRGQRDTNDATSSAAPGGAHLYVALREELQRLQARVQDVEQQGQQPAVDSSVKGSRIGASDAGPDVEHLLNALRGVQRDTKLTQGRLEDMASNLGTWREHVEMALPLLLDALQELATHTGHMSGSGQGAEDGLHGLVERLSTLGEQLQASGGAHASLGAASAPGGRQQAKGGSDGSSKLPASQLRRFVTGEALGHSLEALRTGLGSEVAKLRQELLRALSGKADADEHQALADRLGRSNEHLQALAERLLVGRQEEEESRDHAAVFRLPLLPGGRCLSCSRKVEPTVDRRSPWEQQDSQPALWPPGQVRVASRQSRPRRESSLPTIKGDI